MSKGYEKAMTMDTFTEGLKKTDPTSPLLRIMVFGLDHEMRNEYIKHWVNVNTKKQWIIRDVSERYMRFYSTTSNVGNKYSLYLHIFDMMKPWKIQKLPASDINVIVLPFTRESDKGPRQRIQKYLRSIRFIIETGQKDTFLSRLVILLQHNYNKEYKSVALGTFLRERTKVMKEMRDMFVQVLGTKFSKKRKVNRVYLWETDQKHMQLKNDLDCRFPICNHIVRHALKSMTRKDIYVTWLIKREIPLPSTFAESILQYCAENAGFTETEKKTIWQSLADRGLLPDAWGKRAEGFESIHLHYEMPLTLVQPRNNEKDYALQSLSFGVDPEVKEFAMTKLSFGVDAEDKQASFASETKTFGVETAKKEFASEKIAFGQDKESGHDWGSTTLATGVEQEDKAMSFESTKTGVSVEKNVDDQFASSKVGMSQDAEDGDKTGEFAAANMSFGQQKSVDGGFASEVSSQGQKQHDKSQEFEQAHASFGQDKNAGQEFSSEVTSMGQAGKSADGEFQMTSMSMSQDHKMDNTFSSSKMNTSHDGDDNRGVPDRSGDFQLRVKRLEQPDERSSNAKSFSMEKQSISSPRTITEATDKSNEFAQETSSAGQDNKNAGDDFSSQVSSLQQKPTAADADFSSEVSSLQQKQGTTDKSQDFEQATTAIDQDKTMDQAFSSEVASISQKPVNNEGDMKTMENVVDTTATNNEAATGGDNAEEEKTQEFLDLQAFCEAAKLPDHCFDDFIAEGITHPDQLVKMKKPMRAKLGKKMKLKGRLLGNYLKAIERYGKGEKDKKFYESFVTLRQELDDKPSLDIGGSSDIDAISEMLSPSSMTGGAPVVGHEKRDSKLLQFGRRMSQRILSLGRKGGSKSNILSPTGSNTLPKDVTGLMYCGTTVEERVFEILRNRKRTVAQIDNEIHISLKNLDATTLRTKEEIAKRFDELIRMLLQQKEAALNRADEFADGTRKELSDMALTLDSIKHRLSKAENAGKDMLYVGTMQEAPGARHNFHEYMNQILKGTAIDFNIPTIHMNVIWDFDETHHLIQKGLQPDVSAHQVDSTPYFDNATIPEDPFGSVTHSPGPTSNHLSATSGFSNVRAHPGHSATQNLDPNAHLRTDSVQTVLVHNNAAGAEAQEYDRLFGDHGATPASPRMVDFSDSKTNESEMSSIFGPMMTSRNAAFGSPAFGGMSPGYGSMSPHMNAAPGGVPRTFSLGSPDDHLGVYNNNNNPDIQRSMSADPSDREDGGMRGRRRERRPKDVLQQKLPENIWEPTIGSIHWIQNWEHNNKNSTFPRGNEISLKGSCFSVVDLEIHRDDEPFRFQVEVKNASQSGWIGFCEGPLDECEYYRGDAAPEESFGVFTDNGIFCLGMEPKGTGLGGYIPHSRRIDFEIGWDSGEWRLKGKMQGTHRNWKDMGYKYNKEYEMICFGVVNITGESNYVIWTEPEAVREIAHQKYMSDQTLYSHVGKGKKKKQK